MESREAHNFELPTGEKLLVIREQHDGYLRHTVMLEIPATKNRLGASCQWGNIMPVEEVSDGGE